MKTSTLLFVLGACTLSAFSQSGEFLDYQGLVEYGGEYAGNYQGNYQGNYEGDVIEHGPDGLVVVGFIVYDQTGRIITTIDDSEGDLLDLGNGPVVVEAEVSGYAGSVSFWVNGALYATQTLPPFKITVQPLEGDTELAAVPYDDLYGAGAQGQSLETVLTFM
jgi:hypothetical protein